jgi:superfamily II DNA/RNA helicase
MGMSNNFNDVVLCGKNHTNQSLRMSMLLASITLVLLANGCSSFVFPSRSLPSSLSQSDQQCISRNSRRRVHATKLFVQKKKPRFSQQGSHIAKGTSEPRAESGSFKRKNNKVNNSKRSTGNRKRRPPPVQNQPWASGKSIDELESTMFKRWGALEDSSGPGQIPDGFEIFDGDDDDFEIVDEFDDDFDDDDDFSPTSKKKNNNKNNMSGSDRYRRPVLDPWEEEEAPKNKFSNDREYYDQDDEGFEVAESVEDFLDESKPYVPRVDHLIASKPAGGKGTNRDSGKSSEGGGYFFNPNAAANAVAAAQKKEDEARSKKDQKRDTSQLDVSVDDPGEDNDGSNNGSRKRAAKPLLDETTGKPRLLTVDEAFSQFQESVDEGTMEIIETAEVPILAKKANAQSWGDLGITSNALLENLRYDMNCPNPLAVQEKTTPAILTGNDVLVGTYTGSGKTLSFLVPLIQRLLWEMGEDEEEDEVKDPGLAVLIVAPGRELASQIVSVARELLQDTGLTVQLAIGGTTFKRNLEQIRKRKPNIIVGTPGRIAELVVGKPGEKSGKLKIGNLQSLVMDEFDALLEYKAHRDPTRAVMQSLKRRHGNSLQSVLCSATATDIMDSAKVVDFLRPGFATAMADDDDVLVTGRIANKKSSSSPMAAQVSRTVLHGVVHVPHKRMALDAVRKILHTDPIPQQILIFVENARKVDIVVEKLADRGIIAAPLHGGMGSEKMDRAEVSRALREGYVGIVVATELAARGLDAPLLTHVINLDLPTDASHYAHRAGRCGRGGRPGVVINITTSPKERKVPQRFADTLGVDMVTAEARGGKLILVDSSTQTIDGPR